MREEDRDFVRKTLDEGADALRHSVAGWTGEQLLFHPPEAWPALWILEHVAVVEGALLGLIAAAVPVQGERTSHPGRDASVVERVISRANRVQAPQGLEPAGRFATAQEALAEFERQRARTADFVANCRRDLRVAHCPHPVLGVIPAFTCLLLLAAHPARHANQILELRSAPGFPG